MRIIHEAHEFISVEPRKLREAYWLTEKTAAKLVAPTVRNKVALIEYTRLIQGINRLEGLICEAAEGVYGTKVE